MNLPQCVAEGLSQVQFQYHDGFAEADPYYSLSICGQSLTGGDTPQDALLALVRYVKELEAFKKAVTDVVNPPKPYVPWAGRTGDYQ